MFLSPASNAQIPWMLPQFRRGTQGGGPPPTWDPTLYGTVFGFWEADTLGLSNGAPVAPWTAIIGSNMVSGGSDPVYDTAGINSLPTVDFSSGTFLVLPDMSAFTALSIFIVMSVSAPYGLWQLATGADDNGEYYDLGGTIYDAVGSTVRKSFATGGATSSPHMFEVIAGVSNWDAFRTGSSLYSTGSNTFHSPRPVDAWLGKNGVGTIGAKIAALLIYSNALNSTNRANGPEAHFTSKYAL